MQAFRIRGLNEIDLSGYSILDYGYTRVELHEEFAKLLEEFGYNVLEDCYISLLFEEYRCKKHGFVYKPAIDFEVHLYEHEGEKKRRLKIHAGRLHPLKKYSDTKRYSALKLEQFSAIADSAREIGLVSYREFGGELREVKHYDSDLALIWMVFTVPDRVSRGFSEYIRSYSHIKDVEKLMRKAVRSTLKRFLRKYLVKHENVPLAGDFKEGGLMNVHLWSSSEPTKPHIHVHVCLWNIILWNGKIVRFSPYFSKEWLNKLRELWKKEFCKWLKKFTNISVWVDPYVDEDYGFFNIYTSYTWFDKDEDGQIRSSGRIVHHLRYNARKAIIDLNEFFYSGVKADELKWFERKWVELLVSYSNRTSNFGFMNNWRQSFNVKRERVEEFLEKLERERYEYCPICKNRLEYVRTVTLDEVLKRRRLLVLWYFDRQMNIEIWGSKTLVSHQESFSGEVIV